MICIGVQERDFVVNVALSSKYLYQGFASGFLARRIFTKATAILVPMLWFCAFPSNFIP